MKPLRKLVFMSLTLGLVAGLGACGDSESPTDILQDFDGEQVTADLESSIQVFQASAPANSFLGFALAGLAEHGIVFEPMTGSALQAPQIGGIREVPLVRSSVTFPSEVLGQTFVYNAAAEQWETDETRTEAPENGIRVVWYATDGVGTPLPESERGYFDLTDEDGDGLSRLGIEIVSTTDGVSTLADYTVGVDETDDGVDWTQRFVAEGFVRHLDRQLEFHIEADASGSHDTGDHTTTFVTSFQGAGASYEFALSQTYAGASGVYDERLDVTFTRADVTTQLGLTFSGTEAANDGSGTLSHRGVVIANIAMQPDGDFTFTKPDGSAFSQENREQLERVVNTMFLSGFYMIFSIPLVPIA